MMTTRLGNDLEIALNQPAFFPILLERIERHSGQYTTDAINGFDDVRQAWRNRTLGHQKIATAAASMHSLSEG